MSTQEMRKESDKKFLKNAYWMTYRSERTLGSGKKEARNLASKVRLKMKKRLEILNLPEEPA